MSNSILKLISAKDLFAQIRMERHTHKGVFFLFEGPTDFRRFEKFIDESNVSIIPCGGKDRVLGVIEMNQDDGREDCLGFVDADFDRVMGKLTVNDDVINSTHHDFDLDTCETDVMKRYFSEVALDQRVRSEGGCQAVCRSILEALLPLSALRFANQKHSLGYSLSQLDISEFFDGTTLDVEQMITTVSGQAFSSAAHKDRLREYIARYSRTAIDVRQMTNGHDFMEAVGIALRARIGNRREAQTWRREVETHIRLAFDRADFGSCGLGDQIRKWGETKHAMALLRPAV